MIPSDDHPLDLSPFDHHNQQKCHDFRIYCEEKIHASVYDLDLVADLDANSNPQSSFSIRNYVFGSRSKNIACNWPFSHKTLQICLQHEVKNILPPFQSLESLRNNSSSEEIINSCNGNSRLIPELTLQSKKSKKSQTHIQQGSGQTKPKKPVIGPSRKTETETSMSSKICPVCKVFSSSSNTTLNAHIDQCLFGESTMKWTANPKVVIKHRIKPRKMRLMVDIYKTASHCTVEELDARNGTCWANNSSFPDQEIEVQGGQEKEKPAANTIVDHEGDVNINNNRTKVRILSVPKVDNNASNDDGARKIEGGSGKVFLGKKKNKNHELKHDKKYLKQSPNSKKSSPEVTTGPNENADNGECRNKEAVDKDDLSIVRPPWACSKRTGLVKKKSSVAANQSFSKSGFEPPSSSSNKTRILSHQNSRKTATLTPKKAHFAKKRSPLSTKPSSEPLKKHDTIMQNSREDPSDSCQVKGSDVRSKGSKLSSSRDIERQQHYHDMSDSPVSTISNPSLTRSESDKFSVRSTPRNDEKDALVTLKNSGDWRSNGQSQITSFKNDHQPCCCSRKEIASSQAPASTYNDQSTLFRKHDVESFNFRPQMYSVSNFLTSSPPPSLLPPPMKFPSYRESDSGSSPSKLVIRLMGKNLTVVNTDEDKVNCGQFPNGYQDGFKSQQSTVHPPNSLKNHALDTIFQNTKNADYYVHGSHHAQPVLPANHDPKNSVAFNNGSVQACAPFVEVENTINLAKWNYKPAGSPRSSAIYYPSSFS